MRKLETQVMAQELLKTNLKPIKKKEKKEMQLSGNKLSLLQN